MKTLTETQYEMLQRQIQKMIAKYPQAEQDLSTLACSLWAFSQPEIPVLGEVS